VQIFSKYYVSSYIKIAIYAQSYRGYLDFVMMEQIKLKLTEK